MQIDKELHINDVFIIESKKHYDNRGWFQETYHMDKFLKNQLELSFVQDNLVYSNRNVLRGLHFQVPPFAQAKLVRCLYGEILDVAVDLRKKSKTYGKFEAKFFHMVFEEEFARVKGHFGPINAIAIHPEGTR